MRSLFLLIFILLLSGCSDPRPLAMASTAETATPAITTAFNAWKEGKTPEDLQKLTPAIYLQDDAFRQGQALVDYKIEGEPVVFGTGMRYDLVLTLKDGAKTVTRKYAYRVVTEPNISISREDS